MDTRAVGNIGERIAEWFLLLKGYKILRRNYRFAGREVDLVARKGDALVAVEVKLRRGDRFGAAVEAIDQRKMSRLRTALTGALAESGTDCHPRVDVVVIDLPDDLERMTVQHFEAVS